jgi:FkbH-like protein
MGERELLGAIRAAVAQGVAPAAPVRDALAACTDPVLVHRAGKLLAGLGTAGQQLPPMRVTVLATGTIGPFEHLLRAVLVGAGTMPTVEPGAYRGLELALTEPGEGGEPALVACLLDESYFLPANWSAADPAGLAQHIDERLARLRTLLLAAARRTSATLVLHTVPLPTDVLDAVISLRARAELARAWYRLNAELLGLVQQHRQLITVDFAGALAWGPAPARDPRLHRYGDLPYTDAGLLLLAHQVRRVAQARLGLSRKVLALDLDNTLWGGVLGEVGAPGLQLGGLYPGNCYTGLQRAALRLREQGVILVLASKNDPELVAEALAGHPEMLLRPEAFSVSAVNWSAKAQNLRQAAESLGLSTQAIVFMDDSAFERGALAHELPDVALVTADGDPSYLEHSLLGHGWFDVMELTGTDVRRPELYRSRALRSDFATGFGSSQEYLRALGIQVVAEPVSDYTVARVAQLAARTNQFNLTGRRFDEAATAAMSTDPGHLVVAFSVSDRFGDEGIVGAAWVERGAARWRVLDLVLSCRVLGRGVELAVAAWLADRAAAAGAELLLGRFVPSAKNSVASTFWERAGFAATGTDGEFALDVSTRPGSAPEWIRLLEKERDLI